MKRLIDGAKLTSGSGYKLVTISNSDELVLEKIVREHKQFCRKSMSSNWGFSNTLATNTMAEPSKNNFFQTYRHAYHIYFAFKSEEDLLCFMLRTNAERSKLWPTSLYFTIQEITEELQ